MGQKFVAWDTENNRLAFYDSVDCPVPEGVAAIEVSYEQYQTCLSQQGWTLSEGQLVAPSASYALGQAQATQIALLTDACQSAIVSGFQSSALGSSYTYPSTLTDQANQNAVAGCSNGGGLKCESPAAAWELVTHTQPQAQAVVASFVAWLNACQAQLVALTAQVAATTTISAAQAIAWTTPS